MKKLIANVLGSYWSVEVKEETEDKRLEGMGGITDWSTKEILIRNKNETDTIYNMYAAVLHTLRHELVHAFMFESGLSGDWKHDEWGQDETTVDWIACQMPKIMKTYEELKEPLVEMLAEEWNKE